MLTIRVNGIHGCEQVFQAATVIRGSDAQRRGEHGMIEFYGADNRPAHEPVFFGAVYVMNDSGKTVADYNLGGWNWLIRRFRRNRRLRWTNGGISNPVWNSGRPAVNTTSGNTKRRTR